MQIVPIIEHRSGKPVYVGPWQQMTKVRDCLRPDGRYGTAEITGQPDTVFSIPARMSIRGRKVRGFVTVSHFGKSVLAPGQEGMAKLLNTTTNNGWDLRVWEFISYSRQP